MPPAVLWFRRDLRLGDNPALLAAVQAGGSHGCVPLFVVDPQLWQPAGDVRRAYLVRALAELDRALGGALHVRRGDPRDVVPAVARHVGATEVHVTADFGPYGTRRDAAAAQALHTAGAALVRTGSPYAVAPGRVRTQAGQPYAVFTPFSRAWRDVGWRAPAASPQRPRWVVPATAADDLPAEPDLGDVELPAAGEEAARDRWARFVAERLTGYAEARNRPDVDGTSTMSHHLKWGEIHPRTMLADLARRGGGDGQVFRTELAWREFYADVLHHQPQSARTSLRPGLAAMAHEPPGATFDAWAAGRTGYPLVDAGMRQLQREGWAHNRVRMVVASFLVKDLHVEWRHGARHFMRWLRDGDLASNQHGWQWVAGTGTDPAPYYRVFNPVRQGQLYDPHGDYVRRFVPELRHVAGAAAHRPWAVPGGYDNGYPPRLVDHDEERREALRRYEESRATTARR